MIVVVFFLLQSILSFLVDAELSGNYQSSVSQPDCPSAVKLQVHKRGSTPVLRHPLAIEAHDVCTNNAQASGISRLVPFKWINENAGALRDFHFSSLPDDVLNCSSSAREPFTYMTISAFPTYLAARLSSISSILKREYSNSAAIGTYILFLGRRPSEHHATKFVSPYEIRPNEPPEEKMARHARAMLRDNDGCFYVKHINSMSDAASAVVRKIGTALIPRLTLHVIHNHRDHLPARLIEVVPENGKFSVKVNGKKCTDGKSFGFELAMGKFRSEGHFSDEKQRLLVAIYDLISMKEHEQLRKLVQNSKLMLVFPRLAEQMPHYMLRASIQMIRIDVSACIGEGQGSLDVILVERPIRYFPCNDGQFKSTLGVICEHLPGYQNQGAYSAVVAQQGSNYWYSSSKQSTKPTPRKPVRRNKFDQSTHSYKDSTNYRMMGSYPDNNNTASTSIMDLDVSSTDAPMPSHEAVSDADSFKIENEYDAAMKEFILLERLANMRLS